MDLGLRGKVVLVTAASQGLGYAAAKRFALEGAQVAICSRSDAHISAASDSLKAETGATVLGVKADVRSTADITHLYERVIEEFGGLDILVTNAGGPPSGAFETFDDQGWLTAVELTLMSAVRLIRLGLPQLRLSTTPSVLAITSISVKQPIANLVLSNSIRMAVIGMIKTLALELGEEGIRFNSILPGYTETERIHELLSARARANDTTIEIEAARQAAKSPFKRMAKPEEFAKAAVFLASPAASYLTGVMLPVDGGTYLGTF